MSDFRTIRKLYVVKIIKCLQKYNTQNKLKDNDIKKFAFELEQGVLDLTKDNCKDYGQLTHNDDGSYTINFIKLYEATLGSHILTNLNKNNYVGNKSMIENVINKTWDAKEIITRTKTSPYELYPDMNKEILEEFKQREDIAYNKDFAISSTYTCKNCKSNKCIVSQAQIKSADESMTTMVTCLNCNNKWQFG